MLRLVLAIHNHQPVGNFDHVFKDAYARCYRPFIDLCAEFPNVKLALHYTGPLLEWIEAHEPSFLPDVRALVERGQVEILGGGFYEPMLAVLPDADARGQITRMQDFSQIHFGTRPTGMWLAERVWDPDLPRVIAPTGTRYTLLDDAHFFAAGLAKGQLSGHYVTEKAAETLSIFPIDQQLRYAIPWKPIPDLERMFADWDQRGGGDLGCLTYGDDGEKFGVWPNTWDWVYGKGWLRDFFKLLSERTDLIATVHPRDALTQTPPRGRIYLPTCSYEEMGEWSLPTAAMHVYEELRERLKKDGLYDRYQPFVRGGVWQGFLGKYPEANHLHKRGLRVSDRLLVAEAKAARAPKRRERLAEARSHLYRSQCNCPYWHGLFGGLYLNSLRHAVASELLQAERLCDAVDRGDQPFLSASTFDLDADLSPEVVVRSERLCAVIRPDEGGSLLELSDLVRGFMLTDVLARREEGYHAKLRHLEAAGGAHAHHGDGPTNIHDLAVSKEANLSRYLVYDKARRVSFRDRFFDPAFQLDQLHAGEDGDIGSFGAAAYKLERALEAPDATQVDVRLASDGTVSQPGGPAPLRVLKRFLFERASSAFDVRYRLENDGPTLVRGLFAPELNLTLLTGDAEDRLLELADGRKERMRFRGEVKESHTFSLFDGWARLRLRLRAEKPFDLWSYPVETVSQSEGGFERTYQGSCYLLRTPIELPPGGRVELGFHVELEHLS